MLHLRLYQTKIIEDTRVALQRHRNVLIQAPTGSGKTALATFMIRNASERGKRCFFICHRKELIDQTAEAFGKIDLDYGFVAAGYPMNPWQPIQICSIDTLRRRLDKVQVPDLVIWDESHHCASQTWSNVHNFYGNAYHIGLTATPSRLDGKGLNDKFSTMVNGPSVATLIKQGYLSQYEYYAPSAPDTSGLHTRMGDYVTSETEALMDKPTITGDAISHYKRLASGKRAIVFATSIKHSLSIVKQFQAAGVPAGHLDGTMDKQLRKSVIQSFRNGDLMVVSNVGIVSEGFDLPAIEVAILLRLTQSLSLYLQMVGRALRTYPGKEKAIILDHAGNALRLGVLPDSDIEWTLEGKKKGQRKKKADEEEVNIRQCPDCFRVHAIAPLCPQCGHVYKGKDRTPKQVDGELKAVDKEAFKRKAKREQSKAGTLDELVALGKSRGYKNPHTWAGYVWTARQAKRRRA